MLPEHSSTARADFRVWIEDHPVRRCSQEKKRDRVLRYMIFRNPSNDLDHLFIRAVGDGILVLSYLLPVRDRIERGLKLWRSVLNTISFPKNERDIISHFQEKEQELGAILNRFLDSV